MRRFLLFVVLFVAALILLRRFAGVLGYPAGARAGAGRGPRAAPRTEMVRDRICNTFLPRDKALRLDESGRTHYFCSEGCRARYLAGGTGGGGANLMAS